ncbi:MarR family transcriptional regulator [Brevibacillus humidisoli]|uniref:MarR family winged helix-turn-helix transcriptional regulator n=1 Tax=Brevibacillus humidisoli TaxID=2895522 RepID=UPI001E32869D|nr:MarR family transcriptional regulator [Brevibacillus humidisoli]UFJ39894.1 MarR family transcriptional regulator [Brevibacillus humidisoli]
MEKPIRSVGKYVSIIDRYAQMYIARHFHKYGIGAGQLGFLVLLYQRDGVSQDHLANQLRMDKATVARAVTKLEEAGLVRREEGQEDRRVKLVYLTEQARQILPEVRATMYKWTDILTEGFTEQEKDVLFQLLQRVAGNAVQYMNDIEKEG